MSGSAQTNSTELGRQVADLQVKAFLRFIFEIGEELEKHGQHPLTDSRPTSGGKTFVDQNPQARTGNS